MLGISIIVKKASVSHTMPPGMMYSTCMLHFAHTAGGIKVRIIRLKRLETKKRKGVNLCPRVMNTVKT